MPKRLTYEQKLERVKEAQARKESHLKKRIALLQGKKQKPIVLLKKELWVLTSKIVRIASPNCYTCGKHIPVFSDRHAGHFHPQGSNGSVRYDYERNIRTQCAGCNLYKHGNLAIYSEKLLMELGEKEFLQLAQDAKQIKKWERGELEELIEERKIILDQVTPF
jgi:hypothetical protein